MPDFLEVPQKSEDVTIYTSSRNFCSLSLNVKYAAQMSKSKDDHICYYHYKLC